MLTGRNVIIAVLTVAGISILLGLIGMLRPPDSGGMAGDSYGTRSHGHRALLEILREVKVPTERLLVPPDTAIGRDVTIVLWKPNAGLVEREPVYLQRLAEWIPKGGRVVLAPDRLSASEQFGAGLGKVLGRMSDGPSRSIFDELGLEGVTTKTVDVRHPPPPAEAPQDAEKEKTSEADDSKEGTFDKDFELLRKLAAGAPPAPPTATVDVKATGAFAHWNSPVAKIEVPEHEVHVLEPGSVTPDGTLTFLDADGDEQILAALWKRGSGEIIVVATPTVGENRLIAQQDNSVLMVRLVAAPGKTVAFDEFYHGLTIRGNPFWLLSLPGVFVAAVFLTLAVGVWIWRSAVFLGPPLESPAVSRRSIGEYVEAMARFLHRGRSSVPHFLSEVRAGVLHSIGQELGLPTGHDHVEEVAAVLARRDPSRARRLVEAVERIDRVLNLGRPVRDAEAVELLRGMSSCL